MGRKTGHRRRRPSKIWSCKGKTKYSRHEAVAVALHIKAEGGKVSAYKCQYCGEWHVGHRHRS